MLRLTPNGLCVQDMHIELAQSTLLVQDDQDILWRLVLTPETGCLGSQGAHARI